MKILEKPSKLSVMEIKIEKQPLDWSNIFNFNYFNIINHLKSISQIWAS